MARELLAVFAIVARATIASAQPTAAPVGVQEPSPPPSEPRVLVGIGGAITAMQATLDSFIAWYVEGLYRPVARVPIYALVNYDRGTWSGGEGLQIGMGDWWQLRFGAEYRECAGRGRHACFFLDGAAGVMQVSGTTYQTPPHVTFPQTATTLSLRVGADVGWQHFRFRIALDIAEPVTHHFVSYDQDCPPGVGSKVDLGVPSGLEIGLAGAF